MSVIKRAFKTFVRNPIESLGQDLRRESGQAARDLTIGTVKEGAKNVLGMDLENKENAPAPKNWDTIKTGEIKEQFNTEDARRMKEVRTFLNRVQSEGEQAVHSRQNIEEQRQQKKLQEAQEKAEEKVRSQNADLIPVSSKAPRGVAKRRTVQNTNTIETGKAKKG